MTGVGTASQESALGKAIADARHKAGLTQQQLCAKANLSYSTLAKIERGAIKTPSVFTVAAIAGVTGTTVEALAGNDIARALKAAQKVYKTSKSGIKFVYFDVNGVLVRFYQRAFTNIATDIGASADLIESVFWHYNDTICRGDMSLSEFDSILAKRIGVDKLSWMEYYLANVDPVTEIYGLLDWVADYYHIGLITNSMPGLLKAMLDKQLLPRLDYDVIIDSSEVGAIKPEAAVYALAAQMSKVNPSEILLVDDDRTNVMAAEKLDWHVLWFDVYHPDEGEERIRQMLEF
jgi:putative hydrolase of the HAD superfamily